jgi:ABC-type enterochelin transport system ATPase subunit
MVGRGEIVHRLTAQLPQRRLITIIGPGGNGKTTVRLALAERLIARTITASGWSTSRRLPKWDFDDATFQAHCNGLRQSGITST